MLDYESLRGVLTRGMLSPLDVRSPLDPDYAYFQQILDAQSPPPVTGKPSSMVGANISQSPLSPDQIMMQGTNVSAGLPFSQGQIEGPGIPNMTPARYQAFSVPTMNVRPAALNVLAGRSTPGSGYAQIGGNQPGAAAGGGNAAPSWLSQIAGSPWNRISSFSPFSSILPGAGLGAGWPGYAQGAGGGFQLWGGRNMNRIDPLRYEVKTDHHKPFLTPEQLAANQRANRDAMSAIYASLGWQRPGLLA